MTDQRKTEFSPDRKYRYTLWREWVTEQDLILGGGAHGGYLMVIGLNPSTADETRDDPTIRRCVGFAKAWGYDALCMTNLFAWRDTKPANMKTAMFPVGGDNDMWLSKCAAEAGMILAAWGVLGAFLERGASVTTALQRMGLRVHALKLNADGSPQHPLYIPADTKPIPL